MQPFVCHGRNQWHIVPRINALNGAKHTCRSLQVCNSIESYREARAQISRGATIGFVPTMGGLHEGHMSLISEARKRCDFVVSSVFVNPTQFGPNEDFDKYPRTLEADLKLLQEHNVDIVFTPTRDMMYSPSFRTYVDPEGFNDVPEGQCRPGFFRGVATVVSKLFNIISPTHAFFGQKDAVQCVVIKRLIEDLNFPIELHVLDTCREADGLAMSTRNQYLSPGERKASSIIYAGLKEAAHIYTSSNQDRIPSSILREKIETIYKSEPQVKSIQYISIASKETMDELDDVQAGKGAIISIAVQVGKCRLIDNIVLNPKMPAYHSAFNDVSCADACGFSLLPLKSRSRGPAPPCPDDQEDIADEILTLFRANVLFTNYEIKGNADRVLVYGTLFTHMCLKRMEKCATKSDAQRALAQIASDSFAIPGEASFPLGGMVKTASNASETETIRGYLKQLREAIATRLIEHVYADGTKSKWWMFFSKRKFMNKEMLK